MTRREQTPNSVRVYFNEVVFAEKTAVRNAAEQAAEEKKTRHDFAIDLQRCIKKEKKERRKKKNPEVTQTDWD